MMGAWNVPSSAPCSCLRLCVGSRSATGACGRNKTQNKKGRCAQKKTRRALRAAKSVDNKGRWVRRRKDGGGRLASGKNRRAALAAT
eukprot:scaffold10010_cov56-Isochrysis_galbana.AAC.1